MAEIGIAVTRLRAATHAAHEELDRSLRIIERLAVSELQAQMRRRYLRLHAAVEPAIAPFLDDLPELEMPARYHVAALAARLPEQPAEGARLPVRSTAEALGALYVLEGSTLGGRMILRQLQAQGAQTLEVGFLDPYGSRSGAMWRTLLAVIERELGNEAALRAACRAAVATFALARDCLGEDAEVAPSG
jgi:heme oxygenase